MPGVLLGWVAAPGRLAVPRGPAAARPARLHQAVREGSASSWTGLPGKEASINNVYLLLLKILTIT